jgi:hypothetical protein
MDILFEGRQIEVIFGAETAAQRSKVATAVGYIVAENSKPQITEHAIRGELAPDCWPTAAYDFITASVQ